VTWIFFIAAIVVIAVFLLRQFDKVAGRGPKQVSDGLQRSRREREKKLAR
jgi:hypothetical protein